MEINVILIAVATAIYIAVGYYFKGLKNGESFEIVKCLETVVLVVIMAITGLLSGVVVTADYLNGLLGALGSTPVSVPIIISAIIALIDQFIKNGGKVVAVVASAPSVTVPAEIKEVIKDLGVALYLVSPATNGWVSHIDVKSGKEVSFVIDAEPHSGDNEVTDYRMDFGDGSGITAGKLIGGRAVVKHIYTYIQTPIDQDTGKSHFPIVTVTTKMGVSESSPKAACWLTVHDVNEEQHQG